MNKIILPLGIVAVSLVVIFGLIIYEHYTAPYQQEFTIEKDGSHYVVKIFSKYKFSIENFAFNEENMISFDLSSQRDGEITIEFSNELLQKDSMSGEIINPIVLSNGEEIKVSKKSQQEKIQIQFYYDNKPRTIEIILSFYSI